MIFFQSVLSFISLPLLLLHLITKSVDIMQPTYFIRPITEYAIVILSTTEIPKIKRRFFIRKSNIGLLYYFDNNLERTLLFLNNCHLWTQNKSFSFPNPQEKSNSSRSFISLWKILLFISFFLIWLRALSDWFQQLNSFWILCFPISNCLL